MNEAEQVQQKTVELADELRDNLALDSIAKAQIIKSLQKFEEFALALLSNREKKLQELFKKIEGCKNSQCMLAPQKIVPCHHDGETPMAPNGEPSKCDHFWDLTNLKELVDIAKR